MQERLFSNYFGRILYLQKWIKIIFFLKDFQISHRGQFVDIPAEAFCHMEL